MRRRSLVACLPVLLAGCAHSSMILLPDEDGGHGAVAILESGGKTSETVVAEPNSRASIGSPNPSVQPLGRQGLNAQEATLVQDLPPPARSFILYFHQGTTEMTPESLPVLEDLRAEIARRPGAEVQVTGHTDTVGSEDDNDELSQKRAEEILNLLVARGFDRSIMSAVGRGERELREPTADNVGNPINRRVEVIVR